MPYLLGLLFLLAPALVLAQGLAASLSPLPKDWIVTVDLYGNPMHQRLALTLVRDALSGDLDGDRLEGTFRDGAFHLVARGSEGSTSELTGRLEGDTLSGKAVFAQGADPSARREGTFAARPIPPRRPGPPQRHEFAPTTFYNLFSAATQPVLTLSPGDTVHTFTVDSGGADEHGVNRALYGNPQTGPFYVESAWPGDTLAVHIRRLRLNRDYADSLDAIAARALGPRLAGRAQDLGKPVRWKLDREHGVARPENPTAAMKGFSVPLRPMLGCVAVAPGFGWPPFSTGDSGRFGGNMDFNEIVEGATVYLQVEQPGALLYVGDAHAAQGDGELTEFGLETSMDVEISVDVLSGKRIATPRVESPTHIMAVGQAGSLDDALRAATAGLVQWLEQDYGLTLSEAAQVLGSSVEYQIATVVGRNAGIVAKLRKDRLAGLAAAKK
jgi:acetamidase/formamidase